MKKRLNLNLGCGNDYKESNQKEDRMSISQYTWEEIGKEGFDDIEEIMEFDKRGNIIKNKRRKKCKKKDIQTHKRL